MLYFRNVLNFIHFRQFHVYRYVKPLVNSKRDFRFSYVRDSSSATSKFFEDTRVTKNVLLFKYENNRFFHILNFFALSQFIFWSYLSHFAYTTLRDVKKEDAERQFRERLGETDDHNNVKLVWWRRINFGDNKYRYGITVLCASIGYLILAGAVLFTKRSVKYLTLEKGGQHIQLTCYAPFWRAREISVPLDHLSCNVSRDHSKGHIPIKIKNYWMYFLLDKSGTITNTKLFDYTAGVKRVWARKL